MGAREGGALGGTCRTPRHWIQTIFRRYTLQLGAGANAATKCDKDTLIPIIHHDHWSRRFRGIAIPTRLLRYFPEGDPCWRAQAFIDQEKFAARSCSSAANPKFARFRGGDGCGNLGLKKALESNIFC